MEERLAQNPEKAVVAQVLLRNSFLGQLAWTEIIQGQFRKPLVGCRWKKKAGSFGKRSELGQQAQELRGDITKSEDSAPSGKVVAF